jgi:extracellular factor (EF) 3-hydroxypalmitic acid methyl ester biosynthesis protein
MTSISPLHPPVRRIMRVHSKGMAEMQQDMLCDLYNDDLLNECYLRFLDDDIRCGMDVLVEGLRERRENSSDLEWNGFVDLSMKHPICKLLHLDPFTWRAFAKPRGYAGDAELLDFIYGVDEDKDAPPETHPTGRRVFHYSTRADVCEAVRARLRLVAEMVDRLAMEISRPDILSVAAGHLREANLTGALRQRRIGRWVALDSDSESLQEIEKCCGRYAVEPVVGTVRQVMTRKIDLGKFDFVYSMGLYDYLQQPLARRLTERLFEALKPGGQLLIGNFLPGIRARGYMESFMAWYLVFRSPEQMLDLAMSIRDSRIRDIRLLGEEYQNIRFLMVTKESKARQRTLSKTGDSETQRQHGNNLISATSEDSSAVDNLSANKGERDLRHQNMQNLLGGLYDDELLNQCYLVLQEESVPEDRVRAAMSALTEGLRERLSDSSEQEWKRFVDLSLLHPIRNLLNQDPLTQHACQKPRGYAGDAQLLDMIYECERCLMSLPSTTELGQQIFRFTTHTSASEYVRTRARVLAVALDRMARDVEFPHVLSLASGHLYESTLSGAVRQQRIGRWVAFDPDTDCLQQLQLRSFDAPIETVAGTVRQLLSGKTLLGEFDFIYSIGLYDYLQQSVAKRLTEQLFRMLRPGGQIIVSGFRPELPSRGYMESFMDWHLDYRNPTQMLELAMPLDQVQVKDIRLWAEDGDDVQFLQINKK